MIVLLSVHQLRREIVEPALHADDLLAVAGHYGDRVVPGRQIRVGRDHRFAQVLQAAAPADPRQVGAHAPAARAYAMARAAAALAPEQLLARCRIARGLLSVAPRDGAQVGDHPPDILVAQPERKRRHLGAGRAVRNDGEQIGVALPDRIDAPRQVRSAAAFGADSMAGRAVDAKGTAPRLHRLRIVLERIPRLGLRPG